MGITQELQEFIRRLRLAEDESRQMRRDLVALRQGMRDLWGEQGGGGVEPICATTITGQVIGGLAAATALPNSTLQVTGHVSGIDYGTFTLADGTYSIDLALDPADTSLDLVATGPGVRFQANSPVEIAATQCASNSVGDIRATPASSYVYAQTTGGALGLAFPINKTLNYSHSLFGTGTVVWDGTRWSSPCIEATSLPYSFGPGPTNCPSVDGTVRLAMTHATGYTFGYFGGTSCPIASSCPQTIGFNFTFGSFTARQNPSETVKFDYTLSLTTASEPAFHGTTTHSVRFWEL